MKIAVCVKAVPDAASGRRIDPATKRLDRTGELAISEWDTYRDRGGTRRSRRPPATARWSSSRSGPSERSMRCARRSRWVPTGPCSSPIAAFDGADLLGTAKALAGALERESPELVLFGQQSADGGGACLWAAVADRLRRPIVSQVSELTIDGDALTGKRQTEFGYDTLRACRCRRSSRSPTRSTRRATRR